jgi:hypothetical protein
MGGSFAGWGLRFGLRASAACDLGAFFAKRPPRTRLVRPRRVDVLYSYVVGGPGTRAGVRRFHLLYENAALIGRSHDPEQLLEVFEQRAQQALAALCADRVFVHAGVVEWKGAAILLPGASGAGKSTLVRELLALGATYASDEYAPIDADGRVDPFERRLRVGGRVVQAGAQPRRDRRTGCFPVRLVVFTRFRAGARFRPRRLSQGRAILELLRHVPCADRLRERVFVNAARAIARARVCRGDRGEAREAAPAILALAEASRVA